MRYEFEIFPTGFLFDDAPFLERQRSRQTCTGTTVEQQTEGVKIPAHATHHIHKLKQSQDGIMR